jgi:hypothetical protein
MYNGNLAKFQVSILFPVARMHASTHVKQNDDLRADLLATKGKVTFDASTAFWCKWNGLIMELIREELRCV